MRYMLKIAVAVVVAFSLGTSSTLAACKSVPPKEWEGQILFPSGGFVTLTYFTNNDCSFEGQEQLNGFDALIIDVSEYGGLTASVEWLDGLAISGVSGHFRTSDCQRQSSWGPAEQQVPYPVAIPKGANWMVFLVPIGSSNISIKMESEGKKCKKKNKKKKGNKRTNRASLQLLSPDGFERSPISIDAPKHAYL